MAIYMYTMSLLRNKDFHELSDEEKQQVIETRSLMFGAVTGKPASVCPHCGAIFARSTNTERHIATSKKSIAMRKGDKTT